MNVNSDLSFFELLAQAGPVVKLVILILIVTSMASWYWIIRKFFLLRTAIKETHLFEQQFWGGASLNELYDRVNSSNSPESSLANIFESGFREYSKVKVSHPQAKNNHIIPSVQRSMKATYHREMNILESKLGFLASVGSVSPYVGLFGTVWGIMHSFRGLSNLNEVTLASVAPGIAEALVATAVGLFAAIPAVLAYNRFSADLEDLAVRFESFMEELSNILSRQKLS